jgi:hypothetical protein
MLISPQGLRLSGREHRLKRAQGVSRAALELQRLDVRQPTPGTRRDVRQRHGVACDLGQAVFAGLAGKHGHVVALPAVQRVQVGGGLVGTIVEIEGVVPKTPIGRDAVPLGS